MYTSLGLWSRAAIALLEALIEREGDHLETAAQWSAEAIEAGGFVHLFGTGHSRMALEEMFPRYGSFPGFNPMAELSMTFHTQVAGSNGQRQAMFIERMEGLGEKILENFSFAPTDVMVIISHGGTTAVPIDIARGARERGLRTIVITSVQHSMTGTPGHSSGKRLLEYGDLVLDLGTPVGDALVTLDGLDTPVGPGSTISGVAIINEIKVRTAELLVARGVDIPVITSGAVVGEHRSRELFERAYDDHGARLGRSLTKPGVVAR
ncbi:sugar isomerase domain-containing protein [Microcella pacifica]|uniref:SIS domain-containing protein n=1 Tax=Microcella pacifica TaxID=2591847 RepID=A0A9E5MI56_9MICO|nr:SIS domain-containing protein [Microcella pacifica]NHF62343.1 SIS domain-containing protein [Microcella pacifica]